MLKVIDNSGVIDVKCFCIYGGSIVKSAGIGDLILVSLRLITPQCKIKVKSSKGIITTVKKWIKRDNGHYIKSDTNTIVLLKDLDNLEGNLINGPVFAELFFKEKTKISNLVKDLI